MPKILGIKAGSISASAGLKKHGKRFNREKEFTITYIILGDTLATDEDDILSTNGLPPIFYPYNGAYVQNFKAREVEMVINPNTGVPCGLWEVDVSYNSRVNPTEDLDPTQKRPQVRWYYEIEERQLEVDAIDGTPVQTDANEPIVTTYPYVYDILEIKRYENYPWDPSTFRDYRFHTNEEEFWGAPEGSALMLPVEVEEEIIETEPYELVTYKIKFDLNDELEEPFKARLLHHGYMYREDVLSEPIAYQDKNGNPATINLEGGGTKLPDGDPPEYVRFNRHKKADFNVLNLGPF